MLSNLQIEFRFLWMENTSDTDLTRNFLRDFGSTRLKKQSLFFICDSVVNKATRTQWQHRYGPRVANIWLRQVKF